MDDHQPNAFAFKATPMTSEKGRDLLVVDGYKFYLHHSTRTGVITWRCVNHNCRAKFYTDAVYALMDKENTFKHKGHGPDTHLARQRVSNACKSKATARRATELTNIVREQLKTEAMVAAELEQDGVAANQLEVHDVQLIVRNAYTARVKAARAKAARAKAARAKAALAKAARAKAARAKAARAKAARAKAARAKAARVKAARAKAARAKDAREKAVQAKATQTIRLFVKYKKYQLRLDNVVQQPSIYLAYSYPNGLKKLLLIQKPTSTSGTPSNGLLQVITSNPRAYFSSYRLPVQAATSNNRTPGYVFRPDLPTPDALQPICPTSDALQPSKNISYDQLPVGDDESEGCPSQIVYDLDDRLESYFPIIDDEINFN